MGWDGVGWGGLGGELWGSWEGEEVGFGVWGGVGDGVGWKFRPTGTGTAIWLDL